jgi:DNA-binding MarR family transcriptional regulator
MAELKPAQALDLWRTVLVDTVRSAGPDLSARQLAIVLTVYLTPPPHTVRGLAALLRISKPAVTRALDRLGASATRTIGAACWCSARSRARCS